MGVVSRKVVPACGNLCFLCPSLRARSRQPVKRYKKMLAEILPRNQDVEPPNVNDRKIGKLCEYAAKNPMRIPEITQLLEQRCYKDLRNENFGSAKVVLCIYRTLISSCKEQMPLFACSLLGIVRTLFEQNRQDEMQILACNTLVDFIDSQRDSTYMFNLEGLIPKFCQLAEEMGDNERALRLRSAGMQTLASMVWFMGEHSHISMDFNNVISATLDNYVEEENSKKDGQLDIGSKPEPPEDTSKSPSYWSRVCLSNIARLAKEATTVRRVLEPLFQKFDAENLWPLKKGLACTMLMYLQSRLDESGGNSHLLLSMLVKHLDHKNVAKQPLLQIHIVNVTSELAQNAKQQASVAIIGAISDLIKHLRKCLQISAETSISGNGTGGYNDDLQCALEKCISKLSHKVADVGPILDMMAVVLENISTTTIVARKTISAIHRTAQIISSIPNVLYHRKAFPDALFHQLLLAMAHSDPETRVGAHSVFSIVLMPPVLSPWSDKNNRTSKIVLVGTPQKLKNGSFSLCDENKNRTESDEGELWEERNHIVEGLKQSKLRQSHSHSSSFKRDLTCGKTEPGSLRLSSHQVSLILSSIWVQATSAENTPANFEAMAHTYNIALLFIRFKTSIHIALVRFYQLALSLRSISLDEEGGLRPSLRRSLFTLSSYMLIFSARAGNFPELIPIVKASMTNATVDPYLELVDDIRLQAVCIDSNKERVYGSQEDELGALQSLLAIESDEGHLKDAVASHFTSKLGKLSEEELSVMQKQLLEGFSPDDAYPLGASLFMDTPRSSSPLARLEFGAFNDAIVAADLSDDEEEMFPETSGSHSDRKTSLSVNTVDIISVNELMESVLETAREVASLPVSSAPVPYDQMKSQCEALVTGKQEKMSVLHSFKHQQELKALEYPNAYSRDTKMELQEVGQGRARDLTLSCSREVGQHSFKLPPSSPYDKFMKAAGC